MVPRSVPGSVSPEYKGSSLIVPFGGAPRRSLREKCEKRRKCWARVAETLSARPDPGVVRQVVPFGKIGAFLPFCAENGTGQAKAGHGHDAGRPPRVSLGRR